MATERQLSFDRAIFEPIAAVRALRDARYHHPAQAIAELIDNSIDANARRVELLIEERSARATKKNVRRVSRIAIVDDGHGMSPETLVQALRVGGRTVTTRVQAIGKYGMGLPTASAAQCRRVDVWTWQASIDQPHHSWLDIAAIEDGSMSEIPLADTEPIPPEWLSRITSEGLNPTRGTFVVWSDIDRIKQRAETLFTHVEREIGRTYREFINDHDLIIRMARFEESSSDHTDETYVRPNDPLFLMADSSTSPPWNAQPMFRPYGEPVEYTIPHNGRDEVVEVRYSIVRPEVITDDREEDGRIRRQLPGARPHGKDAQRNMGVSIVRAGRELLLDPSFLRVGSGGELAMHRWSGCEIRFDAGLDDVFGVDHNKQMAAEISAAARALDTETRRELSEDVNSPVYGIVDDVHNMIRNMLHDVELLFKERRKRTRPDAEDGELSPAQEAEALATDATRGTDPEVETDVDSDARQAALAEHFQNEGVDEAEAKDLATRIIRRRIRYAFHEKKLPGDYMFSVDSVEGVLVVALNIDHELYEFVRVLEHHSNNGLNDPWARRAAVGIRTLLLAWARLEDGVQEKEKRREIQRLTAEWGAHASAFLPQVTAEMEQEEADDA